MAKVVKFPGRRAIWFDTAAITVKTKEQAKSQFYFTAKMPHMNDNSRCNREDIAPDTHWKLFCFDKKNIGILVHLT